jgi:uncharacterized DUF497 family protein
LDFADPDEAFFENSLVVSAKKHRLMTIGRSKRGLIVVAFVTLGEEAVSVIGMRPASPLERKRYANR